MMKDIILNNWNFMRFLRLGIGVFILVQGILMQDWVVAALGGLFSLMPVLNIGCCGAGGCSVPVQKREGDKAGKVVFEEVK
ncbi:MAG: hypothetical protein KIT80_10100 [Chitinophagaceae bacterium]|nr:hypothetical protein [Chitinophagaceae bacterium]MCW5927252.1 hypothetical protein [Chitinophagaceae bacterium]